MLDDELIDFLTGLDPVERKKIAKEAVLNRVIPYKGEPKQINGEMAGEIWKFVVELESGQDNCKDLWEEAERLNKEYTRVDEQGTLY